MQPTEAKGFADGGSVVLSGAYVENTGVVVANLGTVAVAGAKTFAVDFYGDNLLKFAVTGPVASQYETVSKRWPPPSIVSSPGPPLSPSLPAAP